MIKKLTILAILIMSLYANISTAQQLLTTKSGQKILLSSDGSYTKVAKDAALDENGNVITAQTTNTNVFEIPTEKRVSMTPSQSTMLKSLKSSLEEKEINLMIDLRSQLASLIKLKSKPKSPETDLAIKDAEKASSATKKKYQKTSNYLKDLEKLSTKKSKKLDKELNKINNYLIDEYGENKVAIPVVAAQSKELPKGVYTTKFDLDNNKRKEYNCDISFQGKDAVTGKNKKDVAAGQLFTYTQPKLKPYFKQDDFLTGDAFLTKLGKDYYLTLNIKLKSKDASKSYGSLDLNSELRVEFINGEKILLKSITQDYGEIEPYSGHTKYTAIYPLSSDNASDIEKNMLDNIGVMWSTGFELYDIYEVDFLINQMQCLKNGKYKGK